MAAADAVYFVVSPDPSAPGQPHYQDTTGPYYYVKFGDGGNNHAVYHRANPDYSMAVNPGVDPRMHIEFPDPSTGLLVRQRYAKYLEKTLLIRFTMAHGGGSEWVMMRPTAGLTIQQLGQNLTTLLVSFSQLSLETQEDVFIAQFETLTQNTV